MSLALPRESVREQIAAAIRDRLAAISADEPDPAGPTRARFFYTPSMVLRVDDFLVENLRTQHEVIYQLRPGDGFPEEQTTGSFRNRMEVFVLAARRWQPNTRDPYGIEPPIRWTIQERLLKDVKRKLHEDVTLGGLAVNTEVKDEGLEIAIEDSFPWVPVELRVVVTYEHGRNEP